MLQVLSFFQPSKYLFRFPPTSSAGSKVLRDGGKTGTSEKGYNGNIARNLEDGERTNPQSDARTQLIE